MIILMKQIRVLQKKKQKQKQKDKKQNPPAIFRRGYGCECNKMAHKGREMLTFSFFTSFSRCFVEMELLS